MNSEILPTCLFCKAPINKEYWEQHKEQLGFLEKCPACARKWRAKYDWSHCKNGIVCPYCDYELHEYEAGDYYYEGEEGCYDVVCPSCGRTFELEVETEVQYDYTTSRRDCDMPKGYEYMSDEEREELEDEYRQ